MQDTVFAPATPAGGAIAVVRLSGPIAGEALARVFRPANGKGLAHRTMTFGRLMDGERVVDECMACFFAGPASYTGEDMAEVYLHGGQAVLKQALALLAPGLRPAEPGEFTKRAFLNGKLDLAQAESVMDLINASTERGAASAAEQLGGSVGKAVRAFEDALLELVSAIDAALDFPDELEETTLARLPGEVARVIAEMDALLAKSVRGRVLREGALVAIAGAPNAGKSSLFNALVGSERAIVTALPGTTRDLLEETVDISGVPVRVVDTAGLRPCGDEAEQIGVARAKEAVRRAELLLLAFDGAAPLTAEDVELIRATTGRPRIGVVCKSDLSAVLSEGELAALGLESVSVSAQSGEGLAALRAGIASALLPQEESPLLTNARHLDAILSARDSLAALDVHDGADCASAQLRAALASLGRITGRDASAETIELIFSRFCVGK